MLLSAWVAVVFALIVAAVCMINRARPIKPEAGRRVRVGGMMARNGIGMQAVLDDGLTDELAFRARLCERCARYEACGRRLRGPGRPKYRDICPNAGFIDGLRVSEPSAMR